MEYYLPFSNSKNDNYTLYGVKHMPGDDCLGLLSQATTLYVHVYDNTTTTETNSRGTIVRSGIVKIGAGSIVSLIASLRINAPTVADVSGGEFVVLLCCTVTPRLHNSNLLFLLFLLFLSHLRLRTENQRLSHLWLVVGG